MPKRIPIAVAKRLAEELGLKQVILTAWDGELMHVVTYGTTLADCEQAAIGGNFIKKALGYPPEDCRTMPARYKAKKIHNRSDKEVKDLGL